MTDLLDEATRALRDAHPSPETAEIARARIMTSLHAARQKRSRKFALGIPLAAILLGSTALASNASLPGAWQTVKELFADADVSEPSVAESPEDAVASRRSGAAMPKSVPPPARAPEEVPAVVPEKHPGADENPSAVASWPARSAAPAVSAPARDPSLALYRTAHELHFQGGTPAQTLAAWDAYLARAPHGSLAPEARYNRALTLARLGRNTEAVRALEPFAEGRYGDYRRAEAAQLIDALGGSRGAP